MSRADIQTILDLKCKEIETLKGIAEELTKENELMELHFEELRQLYIKEKSSTYRLMKEVNDLKEENELLASEIREYNTVDPNDMSNINNYEKWLDSSESDALYNAYNELNSDDEVVEYPKLILIK